MFIHAEGLGEPMCVIHAVGVGDKIICFIHAVRTGEPILCYNYAD